MSQHNGYKTLGEHATLAQLHPSTARIGPDEDGLLPDWIIYHELLATARTFLSKVLPLHTLFIHYDISRSHFAQHVLRGQLCCHS